MQKRRRFWMYLAELHPARITKVEAWGGTKKSIIVIDWDVIHALNCETVKEYQKTTGKPTPPLKKVKRIKKTSAYFQGEEDAKKWILQKLQTVIDKETKALVALKRQKHKISKMSCKRLLKGNYQW